MDLIVEMRFGVHLYGTATPQSDLDVKAVYRPEARDILLQRVRGAVTLARAKAAGEKNAPGEVDGEIYILQRYLQLLAEGQTVALDMLFAPEGAMLRPPAPLWREIQAHAPRLVTRRAWAFRRYCRQQASKHGIKGSRVAAARQALAVLAAAEAAHGTTARLAPVEAEIAFHHDHPARRGFDAITASEGPARLKSDRYALRSALALDRLIAEILATSAGPIAHVDRATIAARADALFASIVLARRASHAAHRTAGAPSPVFPCG